MNSADIIRRAREAGLAEPYHPFNPWGASQEALERFAALVAAAEREACAKVCDEVHARHIAEHGDYIDETYATECAAAIRARGEQP